MQIVTNTLQIVLNKQKKPANSSRRKRTGSLQNCKKSLFIEFFVRDELVAKRTKACYCPNAEVVLRHDIDN